MNWILEIQSYRAEQSQSMKRCNASVYQSTDYLLRKLPTLLALCAAFFLLSSSLHAQGVLTISPGRIITTTAGTGNYGYAGDAGLATSAVLAAPRAVAYDSAGNLYIADTNNHVIRKVDITGVVSTVAGTGDQGFSGDGG